MLWSKVIINFSWVAAFSGRNLPTEPLRILALVRESLMFYLAYHELRWMTERQQDESGLPEERVREKRERKHLGGGCRKKEKRRADNRTQPECRK